MTADVTYEGGLREIGSYAGILRLHEADLVGTGPPLLMPSGHRIKNGVESIPQRRTRNNPVAAP